MFKFFKNIGKVNKVWQLLNEQYLNSLDGKIGSTVIKIEENSETVSYLLVHTDNQNVKNILTENEQLIISELKRKYDIFIAGIRFV